MIRCYILNRMAEHGKPEFLPPDGDLPPCERCTTFND